jgi:hypothetical protein
VIDERDLEHAERIFAPPEGSFGRFIRHRNRKRRNQRIVAGVVGVAGFVAAVWIVTSGGALDRVQTPAAPGEAETGPTGSPDAEWDGFDLPPEGAVPSSPETGNVIARFKRPIGPFGWVFVYADGRVISNEVPGGMHFVERRLTPEGVELVRSGAVEPRQFLTAGGPSLPAGAWADPDARPYVSSKYAVCYARINVAHGELVGYVDPSRVVSLLPAPAQNLLRGKERDRGDEGRLRGDRRCSVLTIEEARTLEQILLDAGFEGHVTPKRAETFPDDKVGDEAWIVMSCTPLFPHELSG